MSESKFYHFSATGLFYGLSTISEAAAASREGGFVWFDFYKPSKEELNSLVNTIGIHPLSIEDCFDNKQVPKIEHFKDNTFIIFNAFSYTGKTLVIDEVNLFIGQNFLITVSGHNSETRKPLNSIAENIETSPGNAKKRPGVFDAYGS